MNYNWLVVGIYNISIVLLDDFHNTRSIEGVENLQRVFSVDKGNVVPCFEKGLAAHFHAYSELAFQLRNNVFQRFVIEIKGAGIDPGDIILGVEGETGDLVVQVIRLDYLPGRDVYGTCRNAVSAHFKAH